MVVWAVTLREKSTVAIKQFGHYCRLKKTIDFIDEMLMSLKSPLVPDVESEVSIFELRV